MERKKALVVFVILSIAVSIKPAYSGILPPKPTCQTKVDLAFLMDSSGSLINHYPKEKDFIKSLAAHFGVSNDGSRVGVITFSYYSDLSIKLNDHQDISSFNAAVDKIPLMGSTTMIDRALRLGQKEMFTKENGGRSGVPKILILITDGSQTQGAAAEDPVFIAEELREEGINLLVVGIGSSIEFNELASISGVEENLFIVDSYKELVSEDFLEKVRIASCDVGKNGKESDEEEMP